MVSIKIPQEFPDDWDEHAGETAAIVDGRVVAFGKNSLEAEKNAMRKGHPEEEIMTAYVYDKTKTYV